MQIQYLKAFYEVAQAQSILAASKKLRITQPALSRAIQNLEASLNRKLFLRQARGVTLTAEGRAVFERCQIIFAECDAIAEEAADPIKMARFAASENLCLHVLPKILPQLQGKIEYEITSGTAAEIVSSVVTGQSEFGFCYHATKAPGITSRPIASVEFVVVLSPKLFKKNLAARDLQGIPFIGSRNRDYSGTFAAKSLVSQLGIKAKSVAYQCNSQEAQAALAEAGLGFTVIPWFVAEPRIKSGKLKEISFSKKLTTTLYAISREAIGTAVLQQSLEEGLEKVITR